MRRAPVFFAAATVLAVGAAAWPFTVDDAFIVARHADHLARGSGWAMNPGVPSDGVTGPAWALPMALGSLLAVDPPTVAKGLGLACAALAAALAVAGAAGRSGGRLAGPIAAAVVAAQGNVHWWAVSGLETGLATLLVTAASLAAARPAPRGGVVGSCLLLLAWVRPEAVAVGAVILAALGLRDRRAALVALGLGVAGALSVVAFRLALFGHPFPLALDAKPADPSSGLSYALGGLAVVTGGLGMVPAAVAALRGQRRDRVLGAVVAAHVLSVVLAGGDWMPGFRLLVPILPVYAMLVGAGSVHLWRSRRRLRRAAAAACVVVACAVPALDVAAQLPAIREAGERRQKVGRSLAAWLAEHADTVALVDVGYLSWASGVEVVDLGGLTDEAAARAPGGHVAKRVDPGWLAARDPDVIVLHSALPPRVDREGRLSSLAGFPVERRVAAMGWVRERFRVDHTVEYAPDYVYVVLVRRATSSPRR